MTAPTRLLLDGVEYEKDPNGDGLYWTKDGDLIAGNVGWAFDHIAKLRAFVEAVRAGTYGCCDMFEREDYLECAADLGLLHPDWCDACNGVRGGSPCINCNDVGQPARFIWETQG